MKRIAACLLMLMSLSANAGYFVSGNNLYAMLSDNIRKSQAYGYIQAIADAEDDEKKGLLLGVGLNRLFFCVPDGATVGQLADVVKMSLEKYPADRHLPAAELVRAAFYGAWPCPK